MTDNKAGDALLRYAQMQYDTVTHWRNDAAKRANQLHKGGRRPTVDESYMLSRDGVSLGEGLTLEEAFERARLDALAHPDTIEHVIRRTTAVVTVSTREVCSSCLGRGEILDGGYPPRLCLTCGGAG